VKILKQHKQLSIYKEKRRIASIAKEGILGLKSFKCSEVKVISKINKKIYKESKVYDIKSISALTVSTSAGNKVTYLAKVNEEVKRISKAYFERLKSIGVEVLPKMNKKVYKYKESKVYDIKSISALAVSTSAGNKVTYLAKVNEEVKRISKAYFERLKSIGIKIVPNMKKI